MYSLFHRDITQTKSFDTQVRQIIRHALCLFLHRVKEVSNDNHGSHDDHRLLSQLDIPKIVTGPLLQVLAEHMQLYINVRRKGMIGLFSLSLLINYVIVPPNSSSKLIESVAIETLGPRLHTALKGKTGEFRYFKNLTRIALPFLLSSNNIRSKWVWFMLYRCTMFFRVMRIFLEELFAAKIMIPTMGHVSTPVSFKIILFIV